MKYLRRQLRHVYNWKDVGELVVHLNHRKLDEGCEFCWNQWAWESGGAVTPHPWVERDFGFVRLWRRLVKAIFFLFEGVA
jgi:hypothetical protein